MAQWKVMTRATRDFRRHTSFNLHRNNAISPENPVGSREERRDDQRHGPMLRPPINGYMNGFLG
jgi:hypothetical protein